MMDRTALVLGATGGIGGETAATLLKHGWKVTALARKPPARRGADDPLAGIAWIVGDAMNAGDVKSAATGASVIVHAVNPPGYRGWGKLVLPMMDNTIAAARATRARIVLPGNVYNFGPDAWPHVAEDAPQHPPTEKGRIRVELERRLEAFCHEGGSALILRFGDFFGPRNGSNWFAQGLVKPGRRLASIGWPGVKGVGHTWTYLPDAAETIARLLDKGEALPAFARFHMQGHWDSDGSEMPRAICTALGRNVKTAPIPWALLGAMGLFQETMRELYKMRYLWRNALRLDNARLVQFLGEEPHTPLVQAVAATLKGLAVI